MIEHSRVAHYRSTWQATAITPAEYRELYTARHPKLKRRFRIRFRPHSIWPVLRLLLILFLLFRLIVVPLLESMYNYFVRSQEINQLKNQYQTMDKQLAVMEKNLTYMETKSFVEERGHQLGYVKSNESQMVMVEPSQDGQPFRPKKKKPLEIND